ncbi:polysaccharide lyase [Mucilaginibacter sp. PAMB04274]|uniref:polysaccharide lyase n=1 Tax=Mucilaginibacter sp. PAMB04274 TaxID=3138568 RepID=UPI0031F61377
MNFKKNMTRMLAATLLLPAVFSACKKETGNVQQEAIVDNDAVATQAIYASKSTSFARPDGTYSQSSAEADMGQLASGTWKNADIFSEQARIRIPANSLSNGNIVNIDVSDGTEYELTFRVRFGPNFYWSRGGKLGFGFHIGNGFTGCNKADDGTGGTARLMWYNPNGTKTSSSSDAPYFRPYVYYKDMPENCGNNFGKQSNTLNKNQWYTVRIRVKSNSGTSTNGSVLYQIDGVTLLSQTLRWTTDDNYRKIKNITFHTFRGGSEEYWEATTDGLIYYDDLSYTRIAS